MSGGLTRAGTTTGAILHVDLAGARVASVGRLAAPVHDAGAASLGGLDLVLGGGRFAPGSVVQRVHPSGISTVIGRLPTPRADLVAVSVDGMLVVVGGGTPTRTDRAVLATADGVRFRTVATLRVGVRYPAVAAVAGKVYVIGGSTPAGDITDVQEVDPRTGAVRIIGHLGHALSHASAFVIGGQVLIAGGRRGALAQTAVWRLDPMTGAVTRAGRLPYPVSDSATIVVDGVGYLIGGEGPRGPLATIISVTAR